MVKQETCLQPGTKIELTSPRTGRKTECTVSVPVGLGGTAKIYAGTLDDGRSVVVKVQRWEGRADPAFEREIMLLKEVHHRNVVHCVGVGVLPQGQLALVFRRAYANPLQLLGSPAEVPFPSRRPLPLDVVIDLGYELLNALAYLETIGIVHHDVKLSNLLIEVAPRQRPLESHEVLTRVVRRDYRAVLIDLGAARFLSELSGAQDDAGDEVPPQITPICAPPEAVLETRGDDGRLGFTFHPSMDVYSAALVIYRLVTGQAPYSHLFEPPNPGDMESVISVKSAERRGDIEPVSLETIRSLDLPDTHFLWGDRSSFDTALYAFLAKRLDLDPAKRGDAAEMKRDFASLMRIKPRRRPADHKKDTSRVFLPFSQGLIRVGVRRRHPLLRAAREAGLGSRTTQRIVDPSTEEVQEIDVATRVRGRRQAPPPLPPTKWDRKRPTARLPRQDDPAPGEGHIGGLALTPVLPFEVGPGGCSGQRDPLDREKPGFVEADAPHCLVSPVLDTPFMLSKDHPCFIGRSLTSHVHIDSDRVSRRHARILYQRGAYVLSDLGSVNGTLVNGFRVNAPCVLRADDRLSFGGFEFQLRVLDAGAATGVEEGTRAFDAPAVDLAQTKTPDLAGILGQLELMAVVELLDWKKHSGTLTIDWIDDEGSDRGFVYLMNGEIVNAEMRTARGVEAAVQLLSVRRGRFSFAHGRPVCPRRIECTSADLWDLVRKRGNN